MLLLGAIAPRKEFSFLGSAASSALRDHVVTADAGRLLTHCEALRRIRKWQRHQRYRYENASIQLMCERNPQLWRTSAEELAAA